MFLHTISKVFKNKDFRSVDLIRKKVIGYFRFFFYTGRTLCIKKIKVKKFHGVKKNIGGGHPTPPPPPAYLWLSLNILQSIQFLFYIRGQSIFH